MQTAEQPFQFVTVTYVTRIGNQRALCLQELGRGLQECSDASIFYHTFQSLGRHHFLTEGFSNDFAQWVLAACNRTALAEMLASLDIRDYVSLTELRSDLRRLITDYCNDHPQHGEQLAFEPFYFNESINVIVPFGMEARTLEEFCQGLEQLSHTSFHFHFIASRLRLHLQTNDFSHWFATNLGLPKLAQRINQIDIYTHTLESARENLLTLVRKELNV